MAKEAEHIDLICALTWGAFGIEHDAAQFLAELEDTAYGLGREVAHDKLVDLLITLLKHAFDGEITLKGNHVSQSKSGALLEAGTDKIAPLKLRDYRAFDLGFETDNSAIGRNLSRTSHNLLRRGNAELLWVPRVAGEYNQPKLVVGDFFARVSMQLGQVRQHIKKGQSPKRDNQDLHAVPEKPLRAWIEERRASGKALTGEALWRAAVAAFPDNRVTRESVRKLAPPQKRGRPIKSAEK